VVGSGCVALLGFEERDFTYADASSDVAVADISIDALAESSSGSDVADAGSGPNEACPAGGGPVMVRAIGFCIDSSEVTQAQYYAFLKAKAGDVSGQPRACSWNTEYNLAEQACAYDPIGRSKLPILGADWCDAYAFCAWAGKRLCTANEWIAACTAYGATGSYPYGPQHDPAACNFAEIGAEGGVETASMKGCQGGLAGLYDMLGNAGEWVDDCDSPVDASSDASDGCRFYGGSWIDPSPGYTCLASAGEHRGGTNVCALGIRCCADVPMDGGAADAEGGASSPGPDGGVGFDAATSDVGAPD